MTDEQIIKALKCCVEDDSLCADSMACRICPMNNNYNCTFELRIHTLDLINRQEANAEGLTNAVKYLNEQVSSAKAEAIKEFAERLKSGEYKEEYADHLCYMVDNLVKEMVGDAE